jgi:hypothetical protein
LRESVELSSVEMKKMKSFRLHVPESDPPPARVASDYTEEEKSAFAASLKPLLERYHWRKHIAQGFLLTFLGSMVLAMFFPQHSMYIMGVGLIVGWFPGILISSRLPICPGCEKYPDRPFGQYCPECGSRALQPETVFHSALCYSCGHAMRRGKTKGYTIHYCTHCGLHLDEDGL